LNVERWKLTVCLIIATRSASTDITSRKTSIGGTAYGRYGRRTQMSSEKSVAYRLSVVVDTPVAYQPRERMNYTH
jgi:hypothetical protein